jgi:hypothetical protein
MYNKHVVDVKNNDEIRGFAELMVNLTNPLIHEMKKTVSVTKNIKVLVCLNVIIGYKKLDPETKQIVVLYRSFIIGDATEVENILINDYKDDTNNRNIRNQPKRIINGGNDEYYVYIVIAD